MPLKPGDRFGRYELAELLGKGGMGEVYRAQDTVLHRRVALKLLHTGEGPAGSTPADGAARILREARAAAGIEHPSAIAIYDVGEVDGVPFLAMEFVSGKTLRAFVGDETVSLGRRIRWLAEIARALGAAHALGIVHRDIKPENVMVRDDGVAKVLDFGIARRLPRVDPDAPTGAALATATAEGVVVGTPFYMAPEQMRGDTLDGRTDQFSWGTLAYELLTGVLPWDRQGDAVKLVAEILTRDVDAPRTKNPEIPAAVDAAIRIALSKLPAHRFGSMEEIADELEAHAATAGVTTGRSSGSRSAPGADPISLAPTQAVKIEALGPASAGTAPPRARWPLAGAVVAAVAVVAALAWAPWPSRTRSAPPDASAPLRESQSAMSSNPDATAAYAAGIRALKDACTDSAQKELTRAIELDPGFAAAHLRRALLPDYISTEMRQDLLAARNSRASLSEHDRVLLDATEPWTRVPPDLRESQRRFEAAAKTYPKSADFSYELGWTLDNLNDNGLAATAFSDAIARDPTFALAWRMKAREQTYLDDAAGAVNAYEQCLRVSPSATACLGDLLVLQGNEGRCEEMATTSRRLIGVAPDMAGPYAQLAEALFMLGEPLDAVRGALAQKWARLPATSRKWDQPHDEASLAMLTGHFDEADRWLRELELSFASAPEDTTHFIPAYDRILVALEVGHDAEATQLAKDYLARRSAWQSNDLAEEPTIVFYAAEAAAGALTKSAFAELRDAWVERNKKRNVFGGTAWAEAFALPAATAAEAAAALAVRPDIHPLIDPLTAMPFVEEPIGRTYLLAGHLDEAITSLRRSNSWCAVLHVWAPMFSTWAAFDLGQALEARGDTPGACLAYRNVATRWGNAQPPSRTARKAQGRMQALRCGP